ncbi:metallophosphoesterase [Pseudomonas fulva]|uniref:metallophosphoesterase family protein n=1 Tax=Pseudomonas fulva TaxID=47880 RepID=UPI0018A937ED|nr:metallophosphoesterase [Pseudomonas fulva]MBF8637517.1 metallophosphoesterase [Pseudomonas fulva]MBF8689488.1 metallophosphoesterase [Pseudomonas fulva]
MLRRRFLQFTGLSTLGLTGAGSLMAQPMATFPRPEFSVTGVQVRLFGPAFAQSTRVFFLSDTHLWQSDERELPYRQYSQRMAAAYNQTQHFQTGQPTNPMQAFEATLDLAAEQKVDLLVLGGDIVSYPSEAAIEWVQGKLKACGIPYTYIAGNHDWHYEGMTGSQDGLRREWSEKRLKPLYQGANPLMSTRDVNGIRFIVIDDSTNQIVPEQLEYFVRQAAFDGPVVLVAHVPLYVPGRPITFSCGNPYWGAASDTLYTMERREQWPVKHTDVTMEFHRRVFSTPNLVGILAGHIHSQSVDVFNGIAQFVAPPNLAGGYLDVRFEPA